MKKILLSLVVIASSFVAQSQVIAAGVTPATIAGNYNFTWGDPGGGDWATLYLLLPCNYIQGCLEMANDSTPGINPQGNPIAEEACSQLTNSVAHGNDLTGKIAVCYRNTCQFGTKALNCQTAGAIGVIIINRDPDVVEMAGGVDGTSVTIPVIMLSSVDGAALVAEMANGCVEMLIGNKTGLYANDAGVSSSTSLFSKTTGVLSQLSQNGSEFNFDIGTRVYNYGTNDQPSMTLTATVNGPSGTVYDETVILPNVVSGDSVDLYPTSALNFPQFSLASYPDGEYTLTYDLELGVTDEYVQDNSTVTTFNVQDSIYAYAPLENGLPSTTSHNRAVTTNPNFTQCILFKDPNGSRVGVTGLYFEALTDDTIGLSGEEIALYAYRWEDVFTDVNDAALAFNSLNPVAGGFYYYPSDLQDSVVYGEFTAPVVLESDQRFLFCAQTVNANLFFGFSNETDYSLNREYYAEPIGPMEGDNGYFLQFTGSADMMPSLGVKMIDSLSIGLNENGTIEGSAYPNPANDVVTIAIETSEDAAIVVTDLSGKIVLNDVLSFANGNAAVNIADLQSGMYVFNVTLANGLTSQFSVAKK